MPRDPQRILRVLSAIEDLWHLYPDQRLGQLLMNVTGTRANHDIWNVEDSEMLECLRRVLATGRFPTIDSNGHARWESEGGPDGSTP